MLVEPAAVRLAAGQDALDLVVRRRPGRRSCRPAACGPARGGLGLDDRRAGRGRARRSPTRARPARRRCAASGAGRRPLRSRVAATCVPSVQSTAAGPSHGSTRRRVVLVEGPHLVRQVERRVAPGRRDQHRHGVRQRAAAAHRAARASRRAARSPTSARRRCGKSFCRSPPKQLRAQLRLARAQPVGVAAHRVDLAVVREEAERLREVPGARACWSRSASGRARSRTRSRARRGRGRRRRAAARAAGPCRPACASDRLANVKAASVDAEVLGRLLHAPADHVQLALERLGVALAALDEQLADDRRGGRGRARRWPRIAPARRASPGRGAPPPR